MRRRHWLAWLRPPRHLIVLFVGITAVSARALGWLGWQLVQQDRALARQRAAERRENAAGLAVASLQKQLTEIDAALTDLENAPEAELASRAGNYGRQLAADSVLLVFSRGSIDAEPPNPSAGKAAASHVTRRQTLQTKSFTTPVWRGATTTSRTTVEAP